MGSLENHDQSVSYMSWLLSLSQTNRAHTLLNMSFMWIVVIFFFLDIVSSIYVQIEHHMLIH